MLTTALIILVPVQLVMIAAVLRIVLTGRLTDAEKARLADPELDL